MDLLGIEIPAAGPLFALALACHVVAGITAVVGGAMAALTRKGGVAHVRSGRVYLCALAVLLASMTVMAAIRWERDRHLVAVGCVTLVAGLTGYLDRRGTHRRDPVHIAAMGTSYVAMLTGFYVDNGPNLPVWDRLPSWSYWVLPGLVGLPLILRAIRRRRALPTAPIDNP